eukprot:7581283-Heterocapsa_arctica.AAC.1
MGRPARGIYGQAPPQGLHGASPSCQGPPCLKGREANNKCTCRTAHSCPGGGRPGNFQTST